MSQSPESKPKIVEFRQAVVGALRDNFILIAVLVGFLIAAILFEALTGLPVAQRLRRGSPGAIGIWELRLSLGVLFLSVGAFGILRLATLLSARGLETDSAIPSLGEAWRNFELRPSGRRFLRILIALLVFTLFFQIFVGFKGAIPLLKPFAWDEAFMRLDRFLHVGQDPWRILHPVFGHPVATVALDYFYYLWFPVKILGFLWFAWMADSPERRQFFLAFFFTWILLGNVGAFVFSSAGPCYFDLAAGGLGPYAELMAYLHAVDAEHGLLALEVQRVLLAGYRSEGINLVEGIAAMPSLHVAIPFLFVLATRRTHRVAAGLFGLFGLIIFLGSIHLGWHYAVDGYAAVLGVVGIWWGAGWITERSMRKYPVESDPSIMSGRSRSDGLPGPQPRSTLDRPARKEAP